MDQQIRPSNSDLAVQPNPRPSLGGLEPAVFEQSVARRAQPTPRRRPIQSRRHPWPAAAVCSKCPWSSSSIYRFVPLGKTHPPPRPTLAAWESSRQCRQKTNSSRQCAPEALRCEIKLAARNQFGEACPPEWPAVEAPPAWLEPDPGLVAVDAARWCSAPVAAQGVLVVTQLMPIAAQVSLVATQRAGIGA